MIVTCLSNLAMAACIGSLDRSALITSSCAIFQSNGMAGVVGSEAIRENMAIDQRKLEIKALTFKILLFAIG